MKKIALLLSVVLLLITFCACGDEELNSGSSVNNTSVVSYSADDDNNDDNYQENSNSISKEKLLSMFTNDGGVWQIPGSMWYQVRFTRNGDELEFLEFHDQRWYEGTVSFSDDGTEMLWHGENNVVDVVSGDVYYWEENDINNLEYNEFYLTDSEFTFGNSGFWVKGSESSFNDMLELYGD